MKAIRNDETMTDATAAVAAPEPAALDGARSMCDVLLRTAAAHAARTALRTPDGAMELTYRECLERIAWIAAGLHDFGAGHGHTLGLMLVNRPEFHLVDAAAMLIGATPCSVYNTFPAEQVAYVLSNADARVLITEARYLDVVRAADVVETIVLIDGQAEGCLPLAAVEASEPIDLGVAADAVTGEDVLTLISTSGTTGPPKAVEITHANMLAELRAVHAVMPLPGGGRQVSFLPVAHIADRWTSHYSAFMAYANTVTTVAETQRVMDVVAEVNPTVFAAVPRVWEKTKAALESGFDGDLAAAARADSRLAARVRARLGLDDAAWLITGAAPLRSMWWSSLPVWGCRCAKRSGCLRQRVWWRPTRRQRYGSEASAERSTVPSYDWTQMASY
jgi:long-chain acyl-CoA synthetase